MDKTIIIIILIVVVLGFLFWGFQTGFFAKKEMTETQLPEGILLFYGDGCPFCIKVEEFISANKIAEKVSFKNLEIPYGNKTSKELENNAGFLVKSAQNCKINITNGINIPFLYDGERCFVGDVDIIKFFKEKAGITEINE